jgi:hypothetical protein
MKTRVISVILPLLERGLSEGAIRALHPEIKPTSLHGAVQRHRREQGLTARKVSQKTWIYLDPEVAKTLHAEADKRGILARDLAGRLLHHILAGGDIAAALGEE